MKVGRGHIHSNRRGKSPAPPVNDGPAGHHETAHIVDWKLHAMSFVPECRCVGTSIF